MYNKYTAGSRVYNGVSFAPHTGPHSSLEGYAARDKKYKTLKKNNAALRRLQARQKKRYMSSDNLTPPGGVYG